MKVISLLFDLMEESLAVTALLTGVVKIMDIMKRLTLAAKREDIKPAATAATTTSTTTVLSPCPLGGVIQRQWYVSELTRTLIAVLRYHRM